MRGRADSLSVSALRGDGIEKLEETIYTLVVHREVRSTPEYLIVANVRHKTALDKSARWRFSCGEGIVRGEYLLN